MAWCKLSYSKLFKLNTFYDSLSFSRVIYSFSEMFPRLSVSTLSVFWNAKVFFLFCLLSLSNLCTSLNISQSTLGGVIEPSVRAVILWFSDLPS